MLTFLLFSCGARNVPHQIDPYFQPFIDRFKQDADKRNISYPLLIDVTVIKFDGLRSNLLAECENHNDKDDFGHWIFYKSISVRYDVRNLPLDYQYEIFLHEIGHCVYLLEHSDDPNAVMYPSINFNENTFSSALSQFFDAANISEDYIQNLLTR